MFVTANVQTCHAVMRKLVLGFISEFWTPQTPLCERPVDPMCGGIIPDSDEAILRALEWSS